MYELRNINLKTALNLCKTKNLSVAIKNLQGYRCVGKNLWLTTKFVGENAKVYFLDVNGEPVEL